MRYCLSPGCPDLVEGRVAYCPAHAPVVKPWARKTPRASGWERGRLRDRTLRRARWTCEMPDCTNPATEADHIVPLAEGGADDLSNMAALCADCHRIKSEQERRRGYERSH